MALNPIIRRHLSDIYDKVEHELGKGTIVSELEDVDFQIKVFTKKDHANLKDFEAVEKFLNNLKKQNVLVWRLPPSDDTTYYLDLFGDREYFTEYIINIHDYEKLLLLLEEAGVTNKKVEFIDDGRLLIFSNGEFYIGKDRSSLALAKKTKTKYYKVLQAVFDLSTKHPQGMTVNQIIKKIHGTKKHTLDKPKIINAINDSIRPILGEQYDFFEWLENGKLLFKNPVLQDFEKHKNGTNK